MASGDRKPDLVAVMSFDPFEGILDLDAHMARLKEEAGRSGFAFDRHAARNELHAATFRLVTSALVRVVASPSGAVSIEIRADP